MIKPRALSSHIAVDMPARRAYPTMRLGGIGLLNSFPRTFSLVSTRINHMGGTPGEMAIRSVGSKILGKGGDPPFPRARLVDPVPDKLASV